MTGLSSEGTYHIRLWSSYHAVGRGLVVSKIGEIMETFEELIDRLSKAAVTDYNNRITVVSVLTIFHEYMQWRDAQKEGKSK